MVLRTLRLRGTGPQVVPYVLSQGDPVPLAQRMLLGELLGHQGWVGVAVDGEMGLLVLCIEDLQYALDRAIGGGCHRGDGCWRRRGRSGEVVGGGLEKFGSEKRQYFAAKSFRIFN